SRTRALLSALLASLRRPAAAGAEGRRAPVRARRARPGATGRRAPPVGRRTRDRLVALAVACSARFHGPRPPAPQDGTPDGAVATPVLALRADRRAQRERQTGAERVRRDGGQAPRRPPPRLPGNRRSARRRAHSARARVDQAVQGA